MSNRFQAAFHRAYQKAYVPLTQKQIDIIEQVSNINERMNAVEGFRSAITYVYTYKDTTEFTFDISFDNRKFSFEMSAKTGEFLNSKPKYSIKKDFLSETEISLETDENIQDLLLKISTTLGEKAAVEKMKEDINDALSRNRLMKSMPTLINAIPRP